MYNFNFDSIPSEESLADRTSRADGKADQVGILAYNLNCDQRGLGDLLSRISAIGEDPVDERGYTTPQVAKGIRGYRRFRTSVL